MEKHPWIPSVVAITAILILSTVALCLNTDGAALASAITTVAVIGGYKAGQYHERNKSKD